MASYIRPFTFSFFVSFMVQIESPIEAPQESSLIFRFIKIS